MIAKVTIDIDEAFDSLGNDESAECVSNFYEALPYNKQKKQFIAQVIEDADDDVLIDELEHRGYEVKKDD